MRFEIAGLWPTPALLLLLLLIDNSQAGLVHRHYRDVLLPAEALAATTSDLRKDQIPVTIIQDELPAQQEPKNEAAHSPKTETVEAQQAIAETDAIAEDIVKAVEQEQQLRIVGAVAEAERLQDEQLLQEEIKQAIAEENSDLLQTATVADSQQPQELQQQQQEAIAPAIDVALEPQQQQVKAQIAPDEEPVAAAVVEQLQTAEPQPIAAAENANNAAAEPQLAAAEPVAIDESVNVRQATQATPTQSTTPPNIVQQLIQNSPLGQLFNQLTGQNQQSAQQPLAGQMAADEPVTPAPTLPGFLNPQNAITSAQQAVQNAAQSVVNSTTQAFQGLQQFATNLGTQFQNTLSSLGGQNQLSTADSTTIRPPGPFQAIISNFVGGNNPPQAAAAGAIAPAQPTAAGPLQGILSFFQGGNRPQNGGAAVAVLTPAAAAPAVVTIDNLSPAQVDNKVDIKSDEVAEPEPELEPESQNVDQLAAAEPETDAANELRNSAETGVDSFENAHPDELIVVNDDAGQQEEVVA